MFRMRRYVITAISLGMILCSAPLFSEVMFFSSEKLSPIPHGALLRSPAVDALYTYSTETKKHYMSYDFGVKIPFLSIRGGPVEADIGGAGGIFTRFELFSESFNFVHADFTGALCADVKYREFLFETTVYHTSSHLGDDYLLYDQGQVRNTGWEAVRQYLSYVAPFFSVSLGLEYKFSRRPADVIFYPLSIFLGSRVDLLAAGIPLFIETEMELIPGPHLPNFGVKIGIYVKYIFNTLILKRSPDGHEPHELSIYYYNGYSRMGSFFNRRESLILCGPTYRY